MTDIPDDVMQISDVITMTTTGMYFQLDSDRQILALRIASAILSERTRAQAIAAAAYRAGLHAAAAWHDADASRLRSSSALIGRYPIARNHEEYARIIRALPVPAEFAAPTDPRDAEIASLRAQLAERDEMLREAQKVIGGIRYLLPSWFAGVKVAEHINALLSKTEGE